MSGWRTGPGLDRLLCVGLYLALVLGAKASDVGVGVAIDDGCDPVLGQMTAGFIAGDELRGFGDVLVPVWAAENALLFLNPRASASDEQERDLHVGLGYRRLVADGGWIVGGNAYCDMFWTRADNAFSQTGAGIELLGSSFDVRANLYIADGRVECADVRTLTESSTRTVWGELRAAGHTIRQRRTTHTADTLHIYRQYESSIGGYDIECGAPLRFLSRWTQASIFVGYEGFDNPYGHNFQGATARVEVRPVDVLSLDVEYYEEDALHASDLYVGARLRVPFDLALMARGMSPFSVRASSGGKRHSEYTGSRMTEMVVRDMNGHYRRSDFAEDVNAARTVVTSASAFVHLTDSACFVDGGRGTSSGDGTSENPYVTIQEGVDHAFGDQIVKVEPMAGAYRENVVVRSGVRVYGRYPGRGGRALGSVIPFVDGGGQGPSVSLMPGSMVSGMRISNTGAARGGRTVCWDGTLLNIDRVGIFSEGGGNIAIEDCTVSGASIGGLIVDHGGADSSITIAGCRFMENDQGGLAVLGNGSGGDLSVSVHNSEFSGNEGVPVGAFDPSGSGAVIIARDYGAIALNFANIRARDNAEFGVWSMAHAGVSSVDLEHVEANQNLHGLWVESRSAGNGGNASVILHDCTARFNESWGIFYANAFASGVQGSASVDVQDCVVDYNSYGGDFRASSSDGDAAPNDNRLSGSDHIRTGCHTNEPGERPI